MSGQQIERGNKRFFFMLAERIKLISLGEHIGKFHTPIDKVLNIGLDKKSE